MNSFFLGGWLLVAANAAAVAPALSAREIMARNESARKVSNVTSDATLTNGAPGESEKSKSFTWWRKLNADGTLFSTMTRFHTPAEIRNEGILFLERENGQADVMLYLPNFKKTRRVERQAQSGSFMGSEFSYSDIATPHAEDFDYKLLREEACPDSGRCAVIEATPKTEDVKERLGNSREVLWIRLDHYMLAKGEYFDVANKLKKKVATRETQEVDPRNHKWMSLELKVENAANGRYTVMKFSKVKTDQDLPASRFTRQTLEQE